MPGPKASDPASTYRMMVRMRLAEDHLVAAWADGLVPGEYHSGIGEEAINAGVVMHLTPGDTVALDHRSTGPMIARGVDPLSLMLEVMGSEEGMNRGRAGHMHLMDPELRMAADGIVGSSGPLAVGNAIALRQLEEGQVAIAFHGEAAMNQGMLMEAYNMAVAWQLPVVFVCKDNRWSITTYSASVTGGNLVDRARSFGLAVETVRGTRHSDVYAAAGKLIRRARAGKGPGLLYATCHRPGGHFEGDPLLRLTNNPITEIGTLANDIRRGLKAPRGSRADVTQGLRELTLRGGRAARDRARGAMRDPVRRFRKQVAHAQAAAIETAEAETMGTAMRTAREMVGIRPVFGKQGGAG